MSVRSVRQHAKFDMSSEGVFSRAYYPRFLRVTAVIPRFVVQRKATGQHVVIRGAGGGVFDVPILKQMWATCVTKRN